MSNDFVDNLIDLAVKLAKHRNSDTLEIQDFKFA
jgi:transcription initiation factor TFIID subunit TAF12